MLFSRSAPTPKPPPRPASGRLVVERVANLQLVGWAARADGSSADLIELQMGGQPVAAAVVRVRRDDVRNALAAPEGQQHGFHLELPASAWSGQDLRLADLQLHIDGELWPVNIGSDLPSQLADLRNLPDGPEKEEALRRAIAAVAHTDSLNRLPTEVAAWLSLQAEVRGWTAYLDNSSAPLPPLRTVHGALERTEGLVWSGWAWTEGCEADHFTLLCQGAPIEASIIRLEREDARSAVAADRLRLGFEIELPSLIWSRGDPQGTVRLELMVGHRLFTPAAVLLDRRLLLAELEAVRLAERQPSPATLQGRQERQYRVLLCLEHLSSAGLPGALPDAQARFVASQAERFGLQALLPAPGEAAAGKAASATDTHAGGHDHTTVTVWRLLRDFNQRLDDQTTGDQAMARLETLLRTTGADDEVHRRLILSLTPYFCGLGAYDRLRPHVDASQMRVLARSSSTWEASLAMVELVAGGDFFAASKCAEAIAAQPAGWLNSECFEESVRFLLRQAQTADAAASGLPELVSALLGVLEREAQSYWGRSHDLHLIRSMIGLVDLCPRLSDALIYKIEQAVLRQHGLNPAFWAAWDTSHPVRALWPLMLRDAFPRFEALRQVVLGPAERDRRRWWPLLTPWLARGNLEAAMMAREWLMAARTEDHAIPWGDVESAAMVSLSDAEPLRLAAHPLAAGVDDHNAQCNLADQIRRISSVAHPPERACLVAALEVLEAGRQGQPHHAANLAWFAALVDRRHHFVGVRLMTLLWLQQRELAVADRAALLLSRVREAWIRAFDASLDWPTPAAALVGAWTALERLRGTAGATTDALRLADEMRRLLLQRHGAGVLEALPPPASRPLQLSAADPLRATLVVVYSCRRNLPTRVAQIRATWARDLDARGIPWLVVVGDGDGSITDQVLGLPVSDAYEDLPVKTLSLIDWVYRQTDFDHLLKIDDDCHLAVDTFFAASTHLSQHYLGRRLHRAEGGTDRSWHQKRSASARGASAIDKSPEPSLYADGGAGYGLSRLAMARLARVLESADGARLTRSAYMEDKLLGDLLALGQITLSSEGHETLVRRRFGDAASPVNAYQNIFYPSRSSPTVISHLDDTGALPGVHAGLGSGALKPARLWPSYAPPTLDGALGTNQLELLSSPVQVAALGDAPVLVVAVARNERVLMPHFLAHYRALGVRHFVLVDNLSDDGTREYLLQQPDVVVYSADTEYRHSHYGVAWQQAVLAAHAPGKWVILADIDEFLVYRDCDQLSLTDWLATQGEQGADAVLTLMIDMYPAGSLADADFQRDAPFQVACHFDRQPLLRWRLGSGCFSNGPTYLSALRHRLIPDSAPNLYTSQKMAVFRYQPWVRLSEGLHYASNLTPAREPACFAHFKYHAGFQSKVRQEVARKQHFNGAEEYAKYLSMLTEAEGALADDLLSQRASGGSSMVALTLAALANSDEAPTAP